ncbi:MAG: GNAT family N-acetyltransferase [Chloroflexi bacterium]|nr:MAG: GNAT family N-acetyltransferase [Chloroflexota bacterium]
MEGRIEAADAAFIDEQWRRLWGLPVVSLDSQYRPADVAGLVFWDDRGTPQGLVTWRADGDRAEIVTVDAFEQGRHVGGRLLNGAEEELRRQGVKRTTIMTTNDNLRAIAFYVRHGYRIVAVHLDVMERVRQLKPEVPTTGHDGLPLRDVIELVKQL